MKKEILLVSFCKSVKFSHYIKKQPLNMYKHYKIYKINDIQKQSFQDSQICNIILDANMYKPKSARSHMQKPRFQQMQHTDLSIIFFNAENV